MFYLSVPILKRFQTCKRQNNLHLTIFFLVAQHEVANAVTSKNISICTMKYWEKIPLLWDIIYTECQKLSLIKKIIKYIKQKYRSPVFANQDVSNCRNISSSSKEYEWTFNGAVQLTFQIIYNIQVMLLEQNALISKGWSLWETYIGIVCTNSCIILSIIIFFSITAVLKIADFIRM